MKISVIMPVFNGREFIFEAIRSISSQQLPGDCELDVIVVDDGSTDGSAEEAIRADSSITILRAEHVGNVKARNLGLSHSTGEIVAFCDADDVWVQGKLLAQVEALRSSESNYVASCCALEQIDRRGQRLRFKGLRWDETAIRDLLLQELVMPVPLSGWVVRRGILSLWFTEDLPVAADLEIAVRLATTGRIHYEARPFLKYRLHAGSITAGRITEQQSVRRYLRSTNGGRHATYSEWKASFRPTARDRRQDIAARHFRQTGNELSAKRYVKAVRSLLIAGLFDPKETLRKIAAQRA